MASKNDITGDAIQSKAPSQKYIDNYDAIFRKKKVEEEKDETIEVDDSSTDLA